MKDEVDSGADLFGHAGVVEISLDEINGIQSCEVFQPTSAEIIDSANRVTTSDESASNRTAYESSDTSDQIRRQVTLQNRVKCYTAGPSIYPHRDSLPRPAEPGCSQRVIRGRETDVLQYVRFPGSERSRTKRPKSRIGEEGKCHGIRTANACVSEVQEPQCASFPPGGRHMAFDTDPYASVSLSPMRTSVRGAHLGASWS